jgi:hypothetical protein
MKKLEELKKAAVANQEATDSQTDATVQVMRP